MNHHRLCTPLVHRLSRRQVLGGLAGAAVGSGVLGLCQPMLAQELRRRRKQVIFIWLDGGMSQLESWDPKPNTQFGGPFRAIQTAVPGIRISELMPKTARQIRHL